MNLPSKAVGWHVASIAAGAWGAIVFAQSGNVDLYAIVVQAKKTWGDLVLLSAMVAPILAAGAAAYRTFGRKQVAKDAQVLPDNAVAVVPKDGVQPFGTGAMVDGVKGTVVATGKNVS